MITFEEMRFLLLLLFSCATLAASAQGRVTDLSDTVHVKIYMIAGDSSFTIKPGNEEKEWTVYYEPGHLHKAYHLLLNAAPYSLPLVEESWYRNGQLKMRNISSNVHCSFCLNIDEYYPDGKRKAVRRCCPDSCVTYDYYQNGQLKKKSVDLPDSLLHDFIWHYCAEYYENGQLIYDPYDPNSSKPQTVMNYYPDGKKKLLNTITRYGRIGPCTTWYPNGQLCAEWFFTTPENADYYPAGIPTGKWSYYNESGKLTKEEWYENGQLVKTLTY